MQMSLIPVISSYRRLGYPLHLHIPPTRHTDNLSRNIRKQRTRHRQHHLRRLRRRARPPQRNVRKPALRPLLTLLRRYPQRHLRPIRQRHARTLLLRVRQSRLDVSERDRVGADAEGGAPFFGDGFGEPDQGGLGGGVVCLAGVAVEAGG